MAAAVMASAQVHVIRADGRRRSAGSDAAPTKTAHPAHALTSPRISGSVPVPMVPRTTDHPMVTTAATMAAASHGRAAGAGTSRVKAKSIEPVATQTGT